MTNVTLDPPATGELTLTLMTEDLIARYVAMWHETDPDRRRAAVEELFTPDAEHFTATLEARGYDEITARVSGAYERFVAPGQYRFRSADDVQSHHDTVTFHWEMVDVTDGSVAGAGLDVFLLNGDGRIRTHYQYP